MEEIIARITKKVEQYLHVQVDRIEKLDNVPNNSVYKVWVQKKPYIFKIYKQRTWPEDGKLLFVNRKLIENHIRCAKIIAFNRTDSYFQTGFLIEECLPGVTADRIDFNLKAGKKFYEKLAQLVTKIHRIPVNNYGYIGSGTADYPSFIDFMNDKYDEIADALIRKKLFDQNRLLEIKKPVMEGLHQSESLPSVLNHGDLSTKNVLIDPYGELTLIDWDDAMAYNWIADIARMTYWMKFYYSEYEYAFYKSTFMEQYSTESTVCDFNALENTFHIWIGLDHLNYITNKPQYEAAHTYFNETIEKLGM